MYCKDDLLPLSALQHLLFCERQCALIHIEQVWQENLFTAQGRILHERVDRGGKTLGSNVHIAYSLLLRSLRLGLTGKADAVEFHRKVKNGRKVWHPFPVEYKRGRPKSDDCDRVQLCAQAICLEEMLDVEISCGALFYGKIRRRHDVAFDPALRQKTEEAARRLHELIASGKTPPPVSTSKCKSCSLLDICIPKACKGTRSAKDYLQAAISEK